MSAKRVLFFGRDPARFESFVASARELADTAEGAELVWRGMALDFVANQSAEAAMARLREEYVNALVVDFCGRDSAESESAVETGLSLIDALDDTNDVEARYGFHRILALVGGPDPGRIDRALIELGRRGVANAIRGAPDREDIVATRDTLDRLVDLIGTRRRGKRALCAAGGGITGIYFELGALKCLDDCMGPGALNSFDAYFGISAGAVVTSIIASGHSVDSLMYAITGGEGGAIKPLDFSLLKVAHLNYREIGRRIRTAVGAAGKSAWQAVRGRTRFDLTSIVLDYSDMVGPPFHSNQFERMLRDILQNTPPRNDFRRLGPELYIGATDQDSREHVLFGSEERTETPISRAVQASLSINPAFTSVVIEGRYYEDGAVTRTSNFSEAIRRDSTLVIVLDPFVPYVGRSPGEINDHGLLYNIDQDIRTVSFTRFTNARNWALRKHPDVSSYTFVPANHLRRILSQNPMDHRPYLEIWRGAYLSTLQRVERLAHRMTGDFAVHDIRLRLDRARAVAERLEAIESPSFADFFPDGRAPAWG